MENEKRQYCVKQGCRFGMFDEFGPGSILELTPCEAAGFLDKLEEVKADVAILELPVQADTEVEVMVEDRVEAKVEGPELVVESRVPAPKSPSKRRRTV